ncbi:Pro-like protein, partial [Leptotrombidium deliense]
GTTGSGGLDLSASSYQVLTPDMGVQLMPTRVQGPIPPGTASLTHFIGEIQIMLSSPQGVSDFNPGDRIAQLVLCPSVAQYTKVIPQTRRNRGFGSTGVGPMIFWSMDCTDRPIKTLIIEGIPIRGPLDTGADASIISQQDWPRKWPVQRLVELGAVTAAFITLTSQSINLFSDSQYILNALPILE